MAGTPGFGPSLGYGIARRQMIQLLISIADLQRAVFQPLTHGIHKILADCFLDNNNGSFKTRLIGIVQRVVQNRLTAVAHSMEHAVEHAVSRVSKLKKAPSMMFTEITDYGYRGTMVFGIAEEEKVNAATDAAVRAMALYAHGNVAKILAEEASAEAKAAADAKAVEGAKELVSQ